MGMDFPIGDLPFRGVSKWHLSEYVAVVEWMHNAKTVAAEFVRAMLSPPPKHKIGT